MSASVKNSLFSFSILLITLILSSCSGSSNNASKKPSIIGTIEDNLTWYEIIPDRDTPVEVHIEVPVPNDYTCRPWDDLTAPERPCTLDDVEHDNSAYDDYNPQLHVVFSADDFQRTSVNSSLRKKGKSTRLSKQPSFKVKLDSTTDLYFGERVLQYNKSPYDETRIRNHLWFNMFIDIPNFTSLRTRFVHLFVNDVDYGLYHQMESYGTLYLQNRGWRIDDSLYKAQNFTFRYVAPDMALGSNGKPLYPDKFNAIIEPESKKEDLEKLVTMLQELDGVYRYPEKFTPFFNKYFNRENYLTWMAINIIVSNKDTVTQNFFLLNPKYSDTFYFLPWDYDGAGEHLDNLAKYQKGFGFLWDIPLHRGFLSIKKNRDDLTKKIEFLRQNYFTDAIIQEKVDKYAQIVEPYISRLPDSRYLRYSKWKTAIDNFVSQIGQNIQNYYNELGSPMPFWQSAQYANSHLKLIWSRSIDLEGDPIVYDLKVARDRNMSDLLFEVDNISDTPSQEDPTSIVYERNITLSPGTYFMKVISKERDNPTHYQIAFDTERDPDKSDIKYYGVLGFEVK